MTQRARIAVPDGYVFIGDPSHELAMPEDTEITAIVATPSCIVVRTIYAVEGTADIHLGAAFDRPARALAFEGAVRTPGRLLRICNSDGGFVLETPVAQPQTAVRIWTNDLQFPTEIFVQAR